ncbi:hypothetical protein NC653_027703 [Populus alba x Populus x berolinensis]|uniref:ABC transporter family G domain-containing protein n=1 Tax=Populus alba x Populus x berolinensis TaxID=444605 RepID=A0AAD6M6B0_9ROSI|nr:hypothetical protein NC653_027703 [Populus alba x Populus x berolinensis]
MLDGLQAGRTIITTIHQPSSRMFHMFDKLLLISEGYPLYHRKARESMECFSDLRFIPEIAMNPAEFLLDLATGVNDISVPEDLSAPNGVLDSEKAYLQVKFKTQLEPKGRESPKVQENSPLLLLDLVRQAIDSHHKPSNDLFGNVGVGELFGAASLSIKRAGMFASSILMLFLLTGGFYICPAYTKIHAVVEVLFFRLPRVNLGFRQKFNMMVMNCMSVKAKEGVGLSSEFTFIRHGELERWLAGSLGANSHGSWIQGGCLFLPSQED